MKKALVLGVLAFFAINIATVQNVNAQDKKKVSTKEAVDVKKPDATVKISTDKVENATKFSEAKESKTALKDKKAKPAVKADSKVVKKNVSVEEDPTAKNVNKSNLNKSVPPTPNKEKDKKIEIKSQGSNTEK